MCHKSMFQRWVLLALCMCVVTLSSSTADANARVALLPVETGSNLSSSDMAWTMRLVGWAFRRKKRINVLSQQTIDNILLSAPKMSSKDRFVIQFMRKYLKKGRTIYEDRQGLFRNKRFRYSLVALKKASKLSKKVERWVPNDLMRDLYIYKGLNYLGLRKGQMARDFLMKSIALDPQHRLPPGGIPSQARSYYNVLRNWIVKRAQYKITIKSVPAGAKVFYNMKYQGKTPYTVEDIPPGRHLFRISKVGYLPWQRKANFSPKQLKGRKSLSVTLVLKRDPKALTLDGIPLFAKGAGIDPLILDRLEAIQKKLRVKQLYMLQARQTKTGRILKVAIFKKGRREIRYKTIPMGNTRSNYRAAVIAYVNAEARQLVPTAPPPIVTRRRTRVALQPKRTLRRPLQPEPRRTLRTIRRRRVRTAALTPVGGPTRRRKVKDRTPSKPVPLYQNGLFWAATVGGALVVAGVVVAVTLPKPPETATLIVAVGQ